MSMSFGWSAGDIALALTILHDLVQALDPEDGAAGTYRTTVGFLNELIQTLQPLKTLAEKGSLQPYETELQNGVEAIRHPVEEFLNSVEHYERSLGKNASKRLFRGTRRKLQWHYFITPRVTALQKKIGSHLGNLNLLMQLLLVNKFDEIPEKMRTVFTPEFESLKLILSENTLLSHRSQLSPESIALLEINLISSIQAIKQDSEICTLILQGHKSRTEATLSTMLEVVQGARVSAGTRNEKSTTPPPLTNPILLHKDSAIEDLSWESDRMSPVRATTPLPLPKKPNLHHEIPGVKNLMQEAEGFEALAPFIDDFAGWLQNPSAPILWLQGPIDGDFTSLVTASVLVTTSVVDIPTVSFFCEHELQQSATPLNGLELLKRLTNSFITELRNMGNTSMLMTDTEFMQGASYLPRALAAIKRLLGSRKESGLIVLIDGFHLLDDSAIPESGKFAKKLLDMLETDQSISKILLCTSGMRSFLLDFIPDHRRQDEVDHFGNDYRSLVEQLREVPLQHLRVMGT